MKLTDPVDNVRMVGVSRTVLAPAAGVLVRRLHLDLMRLSSSGRCPRES